MIMRKIINVIMVVFLLLALNNNAEAQRWKKNRSYLTVHLGATGFLGDLGGGKDIGSIGPKDFDFQTTRPLLGVGYSYLLSERFNLKTNAYLGWIGGDDQWTPQYHRNARNLHFRSILGELSAQAEYYVTVQNIGKNWGRRKAKKMPVTTYVFAGIGGIYFNPKAQYTDGTWHALQPLNTEGQGLVETRKPYSRFSVAFPFGVGAKYEINRRYSLGFEYGLRYTLTDYMDDVSSTYFDREKIRQEYGDIAAYFSNPADLTDSEVAYITKAGEQRGNPNGNDAYMFAQFSLYINLYKSTANICSFQY